MFPDKKKMDEILEAFKNDPTIPKQYKEGARTSYVNKDYTVRGGNTEFLITHENGKYKFKMGRLTS